MWTTVLPLIMKSSNNFNILESTPINYIILHYIYLQWFLRNKFISLFFVSNTNLTNHSCIWFPRKLRFWFKLPLLCLEKLVPQYTASFEICNFTASPFQMICSYTLQLVLIKPKYLMFFLLCSNEMSWKMLKIRQSLNQ